MKTPSSIDARRRVSRLLAEGAGQFLALARHVRTGLGVEPIHDLRVLTRRLRAWAWLGERFTRRGVLARLRGDLRRVGRGLGARRLLDVACEDAARHGIDASPLAERHAAAGRAVRALLAPTACVAIAAGIHAAAGEVASSARDRLEPGLRRRARRLASAARRAPRGGAEMHELRIEAKKARYTLEALGGDGRPLARLQRRIGRAHDLAMLGSLLGGSAAVTRLERRAWAAAAKALPAAVRAGVAGLIRIARGRGRVRQSARRKAK